MRRTFLIMLLISTLLACGAPNGGAAGAAGPSSSAAPDASAKPVAVDARKNAAFRSRSAAPKTPGLAPDLAGLFGESTSEGVVAVASARSARSARPARRSVRELREVLLGLKAKGKWPLDTVEIRGGEVDCRWSAVGSILRGGDTDCSGTLIGKRAVLTAAHCIGGVGSMQFALGCDARPPRTGGTYEVIKPLFPHPDFDGKNSAHDVAVLCLDKRPTETNPMLLPEHEMKPEEILGKHLSFVGFGYVDPDDLESLGVERHVPMQVNNVDTETFTYGDGVHNTCNGDSGGPAFLDNKTVIGVTSSGDQPCQVWGQDVRVDRNLDFIRKSVVACSKL